MLNYVGENKVEIPVDFDPLKENITIWGDNSLFENDPEYPQIEAFYSDLLLYSSSFKTKTEYSFTLEHPVNGTITIIMDNYQNLNKPTRLERTYIDKTLKISRDQGSD